MPYLKTSAPPTTDLYYEDSGGNGQPVVLIHGWPVSHRMWEAQANALRDAGYRVVSYDRRGFGESGKATGGYDYDTFASDLNDLITQQELDRVVLVGFSMGGGEVARYIGRYGTGRVAKAVLAGSVTPFMLKTGDNPDGAPKQMFDDMRAQLLANRVDFLADFFPNFYKGGMLAPKPSDDVIAFTKFLAWPADPIGTERCVAAFGETDFRPDLARFDVPTLVVHGDHDQIVPIDISAKKSAKLIEDARLEVISGAPHGFPATHAKEFTRILLDFLRG